jgi:hypothetical protein
LSGAPFGQCCRIRSVIKLSADAPHSLALLRARRERPRNRRATEERDELAPLHSITSSARWCRVNEKHEPVSDIDTEWSIARKHLTQTAD